MSVELSKKLRRLSDTQLMFWCPGCNEAHVIRVRPEAESGVAWDWNRDAERPTFSPSILLRTGHFMSSHKPGQPCWCTYNAEHPDRPSRFKCVVCHSFVTDGRIQFLGDSTHELAGKTVELPDIPEASHG